MAKSKKRLIACFEKGGRGVNFKNGKRKKRKKERKKLGMGKWTNAGCSFFLGKINLSRGSWGEIVGDDSIDFGAKRLNGD